LGKEESRGSFDSLSLMKDRKVSISIPDNPLEEGLSHLDGNVFLIDQSGSMKDVWDFVRAYRFPSARQYFSFSNLVDYFGDSEKTFSRDINNILPNGRTSFYAGAEKLFESGVVGKGDTLNVVINGEDNFGQSSSREIISLARDKKVPINIFGLNIKDDYAKTLIKMSKETNGKYFFISPPMSSKSF